MNKVFVNGFLDELEKIAWKKAVPWAAAGLAAGSIPASYAIGKHKERGRLTEKHKGEMADRDARDSSEILRLRKKVFPRYKEGMSPGSQGYKGLTLREQRERWPGIGRPWDELSDRSRNIFRKDWEQIHGKKLSPEDMGIEYTRWNTPEGG